jgi:hypothetical protein
MRPVAGMPSPIPGDAGCLVCGPFQGRHWAAFVVALPGGPRDRRYVDQACRFSARAACSRVPFCPGSVPALSRGLEALSVRHFPAIARALERAGFSGERLQRYVRVDLYAHGPFAYIAELADERDERDELGRRLVVRNGYHQPRHGLSIGDFAPALEQFLGSSAHWIHLRPPESTFATVRLRTKVTKGASSRAAGLTMVLKPIESAQARWRAVNGAQLAPLVRAGASFERGKLVERPENIEAA